MITCGTFLSFPSLDLAFLSCYFPRLLFLWFAFSFRILLIGNRFWLLWWKTELPSLFTNLCRASSRSWQLFFYCFCVLFDMPRRVCFADANEKKMMTRSFSISHESIHSCSFAPFWFFSLILWVPWSTLSPLARIFFFSFPLWFFALLFVVASFASVFFALLLFPLPFLLVPFLSVVSRCSIVDNIPKLYAVSSGTARLWLPLRERLARIWFGGEQKDLTVIESCVQLLQ